jgi:hypothetical protein
MGRNSTDVNPVSIVMESGNEAVFVTANIENRFVSHLIGSGEASP